jgi:hypothetical protein
MLPEQPSLAQATPARRKNRQIGHQDRDALSSKIPHRRSQARTEQSGLAWRKNLSACTRISTYEQARHIERLAELGAACVDAVSRRGGFVVMRDPEGNEFCVIDHSELGSLRAAACVRQSRHGRGSRPRSRSRALSAAYSSEVLDDLGQSPVTSRSYCPAVDASDVLAWDPRRFFRPFRRRLAHQMSVRTRLAASAVTAVPAAAPPGAQSLIHLGVVKSAPGRTDVAIQQASACYACSLRGLAWLAATRRCGWLTGGPGW